MIENKTQISVWSNNLLIEDCFHDKKFDSNVVFKRYEETQKCLYVLALIDLEENLNEVSQKIIAIYGNCHKNKSKLCVVLIHAENIDTDKNIYFTTLLESLSEDKPLHRLVIVKDLYQTILLEPVTWFDKYIYGIFNNRTINITTKGENKYFPLSVKDFILGILKIFFLANTAGKTFWLIGEEISDLDIAYLIKKKLENIDNESFEINAESPHVDIGIPVKSLGNQTSVILNWEPQDEYSQSLTTIAKTMFEEKSEVENKNRLSKKAGNSITRVFYDLLTKIRLLKQKLASNKIKISNTKIQYVYLYRSIETLVFLIVVSYTITTSLFFGGVYLSLKYAQKSIISLKDGSPSQSIYNLNTSKIFLKVGESSYEFLSPIIKIIGDETDKKNHNLLSFQNYLLVCIGNTNQTYTLAENIYDTLSGKKTDIKNIDISLALKSNLNQIYENLNQLEILAEPGKLPNYLESEIKSSPDFKNIKNTEQLVINLMKIVGLIPGSLMGESPKNIVILFQNSSELHSTGGRIDYMLSLVLQNGKVISNKLYSSAEIDSLADGVIQAPPLLKQIINADDWNFKDLNYNPDFPQTATNISWYLEKTLKINSNVIIAVNNSLIEQFAVAEKKLTESDSTLDSGLYKELIANYSEKLLAGNLPINLLGSVISKEMSKNSILYWTSNIDNQMSIGDQAYSGFIHDYPCHNGLFNANSCISQTSYINETSYPLEGKSTVSDRNITHQITLDSDKINHQYTLQYKNNRPEYSTESPNSKIFQLYITSPSELKNITVDDILTATPGVMKQTENNLDRYQIPMYFSDNKPKKIAISFSTPTPKISSYPLGYSLTEYRQSGSGDTGTKLDIIYPETVKPSTVTSPVSLAPSKFSYTFPPKTATFGVSFTPNQP